MRVLQAAAEREHEQVVFFNYPEVGLKAIVGIHNTVLGPSLGGCRMRLYKDEEQAFEDVLRLSEGMTYKSSLAGLDLGGGKSCIIADPHMKEGREELFVQFGKCVEALSGRYIAAEDMGTSVQDVVYMQRETEHLSGRDPADGGGGDPSPWTARGVHGSIVAACERVYGTSDLAGRKVALQGVGHVGMYLLDSLVKAGAAVTICDTNESHLELAKKEYGVEVCGLDDIYDVDCDVYAPCATGQTVNPETVARMKCKIIAGAANNQLSDPGVYNNIEAKEILYCPDFAINSGGVISCAGELQPGGWNEGWVADKVDNIYFTMQRVLDEAQKRGRFTELVAIELAKERIEQRREQGN